MATEAQREHLAATVKWLTPYAAQLDYPPGDVRQTEDARDWNLTEQQAEHVLKAGGRMMFDCSEFYAWLLKCAGLWHLAQPGWTGSDLALASMPHYTNGKAARVGAGVVFGEPPGHHIAMVIHPDPVKGNPGIVGHGVPGLRFNTVSAESEFQPPGITYLSIAHL